MVIEDLKKHWNEDSKQKRILNISIDSEIEKYDSKLWFNEAVISDTLLEDFIPPKHYDKLTWLRDKLLSKTSFVNQQILQAKVFFYSSNFWKWNLAAADHRREAQKLFSPFLSRYNL
jgi:hypothetical protein